MPVTTLDPNTALIVVDLQKGLAGALPAEVFGPVVERSAALAEAFRERKLPVVLVTADGLAPGRTEHPNRTTKFPDGFADLLEALKLHDTDIRITKQTLGAFTGGDLAPRLRSLGVTQVVVTGVATSLGVESTARQAYEAGFNVTLATDAMADVHPLAHERSVELVFPRIGERGSTQDILALLP